MQLQTILTLLGSLGIPVIVTALFKLIENRRTLRSGAPKINAEAVDIGIESQLKVIKTLEAENSRLTGKIERAETLADARDQRHEAQVQKLQLELEQVRHDLFGQVEIMRADWEHEQQLQRAETHAFRRQVAALLLDHDIALPSWWNQPLRQPNPPR